MKTSTVIGVVSVGIAIFLIYYSFGFYVDRSLGEACESSDEKLSEFAQIYFVDRITDLAAKAGVSDLSIISSTTLTPKLTELRTSGKLEGDDLRKLAEAEVLYIVLEEYLGEKACDLHKNMARLGQVSAIVLYGNAFSANSMDLSNEAYYVEQSSRTIDHTQPEKVCGFSAGNWILRGEEENYCEALHSENYRLVKALEMDIGMDEDTNSREFKAVLANCFAKCVNKEKDCVDDCWNQKLG